MITCRYPRTFIRDSDKVSYQPVQEEGDEDRKYPEQTDYWPYQTDASKKRTLTYRVDINCFKAVSGEKVPQTIVGESVII